MPTKKNELIVPYRARKVKCQPPHGLLGCKQLEARFKDGRKILLTRQPGHPEGKGENKVAYRHEFISALKKNRTRTKLVFCLSPEACVALVEMYLKMQVGGPEDR